MGEIADMISAINDLGDSIVNGGFTSKIKSVIAKPSTKSLSALSLQGTANFPVLVSDSIDIDDAIMISKALEREFATFFLTVLTMNPYMEVPKGGQIAAGDYLKQFHQNIEVSEPDSLKNTLIGTSQSLITEQLEAAGVDYNCWLSESFQLVSAIYQGVNDRGINMQNTAFNYSVEEVTEQSILNNKGTAKVGSLMEASGRSQHGQRNSTRPGRTPINVEVNPQITVKSDSSRDGAHRSNRIGMTGNRDPKAINYLGNNDFKKANELVPTLLHVRVYPYMADSNEALDPLDFVIGVKATLHQISSVDMITNIARGLRNDSLFFNFIRWTTGETKFFKDFLFAIDQQKLDASNAGHSSNGWWSALKRRKASSQIRRFGKNGACLPNTTLVCSVDDLDMLKAEYGFDLTGSNTTPIIQLMKQYFLLSFVRVNPALQRVDFLFDGNSQFDTSTYSTLSKEGGRDDKKFKDMMKMLGRGM